MPDSLQSVHLSCFEIEDGSHTSIVSQDHLLPSTMAASEDNIIYACTSLADTLVMQASGRQDAGWLNPIVNVLDQTLTTIQSTLDTLHVPYSYGWSIILLTLLTKVFTFPFTKIQVRNRASAVFMKSVLRLPELSQFADLR